MPRQDPTAGQPELRAFLRAVYDGLGQPPLHAQHVTTIGWALALLSEQDLAKRFAVRERLGELLADRGERP